MKGLSRKQIIVPISRDNKKNFMEESNIYVSNMNKALKNIKFNILVDFICSDVASIIIITYKVTISLDLQTINIKNERSGLNIFFIFLFYF